MEEQRTMGGQIFFNDFLKNHRGTICAAGILMVLTFTQSHGIAQIAPHITIDGSLQGLAGSGMDAGPQGFSDLNVEITREMGLVRGSNLFHSFGNFNIPTDGSVTFSGPGSISNILSRVTGSSVSNIDGTLASTIDGANVFLMNPQGIIFGPNASLNISGSFYATTANNIELEGGILFNVISDQQTDALLTSAPPEAFGFLGQESPVMVSGSAAIEIQGLDSQGSSVTIVGRDAQINGTLVDGVSVNGNVLTIGGDFVVASLGSPGKAILGSISFDKVSEQGQVAISGSVTSNGGEVEIQGGQIVIPGTITTEVGNLLIADNGNRASRVDVSGTIITNGGKVGIGQIDIPVDEVTLSGTIITNDFSSQISGGPVEIHGSTIVGNGATILTLPSGEFDFTTSGGSVNVTATETISLTDSFINTSSDGTFSGPSGAVDLQADQHISLINTSVLSQNTFSSGQGGKVFLGPLTSATNPIIELEGSEIRTDGNGFTDLNDGTVGDIVFQGTQITLQESLLSSLIEGNKESGTVNITATEKLTIIGGDSTATQGGIRTSAQGEKAAGSITIVTDQVSLENGGFIQSESDSQASSGNIDVMTTTETIISGNALFESNISNSARGSGKGGTLKLTTGNLSVINGGRVKSETNDGSGGTVTATATGTITLSGPTSEVTSESTGSGKGGTIELVAGQDIVMTNFNSSVTAANTGTGESGDVKLTASGSILMNNSKVTTESSQSTGGNISFAAGQNVELNNNSTITATSTTGNAGNIDIGLKQNPIGDSILITDSSVITEVADKTSSGGGGNINFFANNLISVDPSLISSSVGTGIGGDIALQAPSIVVQLSKILAQAQGGQGGNITLTSNLVLTDPFSVIDASGGIGGTPGIVDIQSPIRNLKGTIAPLPENIVSLATMYAESCAAQKGGKFSSFVRGERDGIVPSPGGFMPSPILYGNLSDGLVTHSSPLSSDLNVRHVVNGRALDSPVLAGVSKIAFTIFNSTEGCSS